MCNINVVFNRRKVDDVRVNECMNVMSFNSFLTNPEGEGFISLSKSKGLLTGKSAGKMVFSGTNYFLATHQRIATSGKNEANIHPHPTKNLILLHNGIFSGKGNSDESDTRQYLKLLDDTYVGNGRDIVKSIRDVSKVVSGTYSVLVYEIKTGKFFYFKEDCTNMYVVMNDDYLVLSTNFNNIKYARDYFKIKGVVKEVKPFRIYDVLKGFRSVAKFSPKKIVVNSKDALLSDFTRSGFKDYFKDADGLMLDEMEINRGD